MVSSIAVGWAEPSGRGEHSPVSSNSELHNKTATVSLSATKEGQQLTDDMNFHLAGHTGQDGIHSLCLPTQKKSLSSKANWR